MSAYNLDTFTTPLEFDTTSGVDNTCAQIDENHFINFWEGADYHGFAQTFEVNTTTWEISTVGAVLEFDTTRTASGTYHSCCAIDSNHFINFWRGTSSHKGEAQVFVVNTSTWAVTTAGARKEFEGTAINYNVSNSCFRVDANHVINFWGTNTGSRGRVQVFTINTSTWAITTTATYLQFEPSYSSSGNACFQIDTNHFINFWQGADGWAQSFEVNTSTWAVTTTAARLNIDSASSNDNNCFAVDSTHFINFWRGADNDGFVQIFTVETSTYEVSTSQAPLEYDTQNGANPSCYQIDSTHFINFWYDGQAQTFTINTSTWAITTTVDKILFDTAGNSNSCYRIDTAHFINFYSAENSHGYTQVVFVTLENTQTATSKANITTTATQTQTIQTKSHIIGIFQLAQPMLNTVQLPFPSRASIQRIDHVGPIRTLMGKEKRDITGKKYRYVMEWEVIKPEDYDALEEEIRAGVPMYFTYRKWPQSDTVQVFGQLSERTHVTGTGNEYYWSSVSLILTEVNPR